jgi:hypothetical protein
VAPRGRWTTYSAEWLTKAVAIYNAVLAELAKQQHGG